LLKADFKRHAYLPHWHDTYTIALVEAGCERVNLGGIQRHASPGDVVLLNPGEIHDGEAHDPTIGWDFRVLYVSSEILLGNILSSEEGQSREIVFRNNLLHHPGLWRTLLTMYQALSASNSLLDRTSTLFSGLSRLTEYAVEGTTHSRAAYAKPSLDRARQFLDASWAEPVSLEDLARIAGLSRFHLLREFRRQFGLPPHAYQLQLRVSKAKDMLFEGTSASDVALLAGFYDQAHLTNVMKRYVGVTPGRINQQ
jgi:AraC-like DNA-binding protein